MIEHLLLGADGQEIFFLKIFRLLPHLEQKRVMYAVLKHLAETFLNRLSTANTPEAAALISAAAGVVDRLVDEDESRKNHLVVWLTGATGAGLGDAVGIRRAVLAALAKDRDTMTTVLEKILQQFGDELYIRHSPALQQDGRSSHTRKRWDWADRD